MTRTRRKVPVVGVAAVVLAAGGVIALNQNKLPKKPEYRCQSNTVEVEFQVSVAPLQSLDIEYFSTGNPAREARVRTVSWLTIEPAVNCPGVATLAASGRRESGEVTCSIWVNDQLIADDRSRGGRECAVKVTLVKR